MRKKNRQTEIHFLEPAKAPDAEGGWLYEMGIPVQRSGLPYDIDVMQKIPMPPNRDTVSNTYIQDIAAETLNTMCQEIPEQEMKRPWVSTALTDKRVKDRNRHWPPGDGRQRRCGYGRVCSVAASVGCSLVSGRVSVPKPLSQIQRSTRWLLQGLSPRPSFGGFGLKVGCAQGPHPARHTDHGPVRDSDGGRSCVIPEQRRDPGHCWRRAPPQRTEGDDNGQRQRIPNSKR